MLRYAILLALPGCGRIGFDNHSTSGIAGGFDRVPPVDGLLAWYPMDLAPSAGVIPDESGNGRDALCAGAACPTAVAARVDGGLLYDGVDDVVVAPGGGLGTTFTIAAFVRFTGSTSGVITSKALGAGPQSWRISYSDVNREYTLTTNDGATDDMLTFAVDPPFDWVHIAATCDGTTKRLYVDGIERTARSAVVAIDGSDIRIGVWSGALDDFRLYDRSLTGEEIFTLASQ